MTIVNTPDAPHPKAQLRSVNFEVGTIRFNWLNSDSSPADSGNSIARFTAGDDMPTDEEIAAAITASTP